MTKKLPLHIKLQRKAISRACVLCHKKHLQCDPTRPCKNCVKRGVADSCEDVQRKRSRTKTKKEKGKPSNEDAGLDALATLPEAAPELAQKFPNILPSDKQRFEQFEESQAPLQHVEVARTSSQMSINPEEINDGVVNNFDTDFFTNIGGAHVTVGAGELDFDNIFYDGLNNQTMFRPYMKLGNAMSDDFSSLPSEQEPSIYQDRASIPKVSSQEFVNLFKRNHSYKSPMAIRKKVFQEVGDIYAKFPIFLVDKLYHVTEGLEPGDHENLKYIINILSFSYMKSYQELIKYFYDRFYTATETGEAVGQRKLFFKVLEMIWISHNYFRIQNALVQSEQNNLTNFNDSLLTEVIMQRQLLNFESLINNLTSTPAMIWRRSTEISFISDELCHLIGIKSKAKFLLRRRFLCELIDDMSVLNYFKLFNEVTLKNKEVGHYHNVHNRFNKLKYRFKPEEVDDLDNELSDERINNGSGTINGGIVRFNCLFINQNFRGEGEGETVPAYGASGKEYSQEINEEVEQKQKYIRASSILTIKKDMFDIPMLIVGQFLPVY